MINPEVPTLIGVEPETGPDERAIYPIGGRLFMPYFLGSRGKVARATARRRVRIKRASPRHIICMGRTASRCVAGIVAFDADPIVAIIRTIA
jgi:hypothetical protein